MLPRYRSSINSDLDSRDIEEYDCAEEGEEYRWEKVEVLSFFVEEGWMGEDGEVAGADGEESEPLHYLMGHVRGRRREVVDEEELGQQGTYHEINKVNRRGFILCFLEIFLRYTRR